MRRIFRTIAVVASLSAMGSAARAQTLFTGSGCSGSVFLFCASWTATYLDATHVSLFITNTSQNAPASNTNSAFTQIGIGNVTIADPASMNPVTGWQYDSNLSGFNGFGLLENQFGSITTNGINNALADGSSLTFSFTMGSSIGTYAQAQTAFSGAQIAIHDQGGPVAGCSSKGVLVGAASGQNTSNFITSCAPTTTTPEPSTYALMATGLIGVFGFARRRRADG
ncbi:MAG TPA: PEP-CTERM sorting domain-containing protein [Gemmatimonadaceae bacterium]